MHRAAVAAIHRFTGRIGRVTVTVAGVVALLAGVNVLIRFGPDGTGLVAGPLAALLLVVLARRVGLSWDDLGLARRSLRRGVGFAVLAIAVVAVVYVLGTMFPSVRSTVIAVRSPRDPGRALVQALLVIPLGTILLEEIAFRGVLLGLLRRGRGIAWAFGFSSALFGLWHVLPSLPVPTAAVTVGAVGGPGFTRFLAVAAIVGVTALLGLVLCELRRRSGSLLAAAVGHWAANGMGVLLAAHLWTQH